jgi:hypothetical protein
MMKYRANRTDRGWVCVIIDDNRQGTVHAPTLLTMLRFSWVLRKAMKALKN